MLKEGQVRNAQRGRIDTQFGARRCKAGNFGVRRCQEDDIRRRLGKINRLGTIFDCAGLCLE